MVNIANPLPPPDLPQMTSDYSISLNDLKVAGGVFFRIHQYEDAARGDYLTVLWDEEPVLEALIDDLSTDFPAIGVITGHLGLGFHYINFTVSDNAGNKGVSIGINVQIIDGEPDVKYPAPVFSDAIGGLINQTSITANAGTHVHVAPYNGIIINDSVLLFWKGVSADGKITDGGIDSHTILATDIIAGVTFLIPQKKLEHLMDKAVVTASYQVRRKGAVLGVSEIGKAILNLTDIDRQPSMIISTGAANTDYEAIHLNPFNQGVVKGPPGATVILSAVGDAIFDESGTGTYQFILNESAEGSFKVRSAEQGNDIISAEIMSNPGVTVQQIIRFGPYFKGIGNIQYLNYSTGAPANGVTPCSIYLKAAEVSGPGATITRVRVSVSGNAIIDGYHSHSADILLNSDKSAEIDIINSVAETVNVELSLPESSGSINRFYLAFRSFPNDGARNENLDF
ncbi:hypothetical protein H2241_23435 [Pantoea ananatis]|uniref:hypothetical protein n=1 Tax=Pantoea ananas TaxID=553 RepID=UPI00158A0A19|nr:hypothetical protein [Pantoea ananatis]MBA4823865.1 hypothetical protein [Pantoea ananatis]QKV86015.1 hypothetical protein FOB88_02160 [Pantoea ananatis]